MDFNMTNDRLIPLSALQHYVFCPRQCFLIHNERVWSENVLTTEGNLLHKRVDGRGMENRKGIRFERGVSVMSEKLGLTGKLDLIEIDLQTNQYTPIEYKRGHSKADNCDKVQLCAQALCLEEMLTIRIEYGALWYWQTRHRELVDMSELLRKQTIEVILQTKYLFDSALTPKVKYTAKCNSCSLYDLCNPKLIIRDKSTTYIQSLFSQGDTN